MKKISRYEAREKIESFFKRKEFTPEEVKKMKRLAMKYNIKLAGERKKFCKKCLSQLRGKTRITKHYKTIICGNCQYKNRHKL